MGRIQEQAGFLKDVCKLLAEAERQGFLVTGGELYRTPEQQQIYVQTGRSKTLKSNHLVRQAIDLNFFKPDGKGGFALTYAKTDLQSLGDFWEKQDPKNRWGGNWTSFKDTPHFERQP